MTKWINVKDKLPEKEDSYLVGCKEDGETRSALDEWYRGEWIADKEFCCGGIRSEDITHWMEIPQIEENE